MLALLLGRINHRTLNTSTMVLLLNEVEYKVHNYFEETANFFLNNEFLTVTALAM